MKNNSQTNRILGLDEMYNRDETWLVTQDLDRENSTNILLFTKKVNKKFVLIIFISSQHCLKYWVECWQHILQGCILLYIWSVYHMERPRVAVWPGLDSFVIGMVKKGKHKNKDKLFLREANSRIALMTYLIRDSDGLMQQPQNKICRHLICVWLLKKLR